MDAPLPPTPPQPPPAGAPPPDEQRRLLRDSLATGLTPLFPVPLVDDWLLDGLRDRAVANLLGGRGVALAPAEVRLLARGESAGTGEGCLGCLTSAVIWPLRLIFKILFRGILRKLFFFWAIKDCASELSHTYHLGHLLRHAAALGAFPGPDEERPARLLRIRKAAEAALRQLGFTPLDPWIRILFRRSWRAIVGATGAMSDKVRREGRGRPAEPTAVYRDLDEEAERLDPLVDELAAAVEGEKDYLRDIEKAFEDALRA